MKILSRRNIFSADDIDELDELETAEQKYSSAKTAGNGKQGKVPAVFKLASFPEGSLVLDYGGGTDESAEVAQNYLDQFGCTEVLFDKYNRTPSQNREAVRMCKQNRGADVAVCSNVLNVIAEYESRIVVLRNIQKLTKPGGTVYITVYEGDKKQRDRGSRSTGADQYQNFKATADYLEEVREVFPDAVTKGKLIIAHNL